jgi:chloride channel protein, CIC family
MDEEILDYNEQKEGWVSKMVDWRVLRGTP